MKLKVLLVTTSRADFGLLTPLFRELQSRPEFDPHWCVTGSHLSHEHGYTAQLIEKDGFVISGKVEINPLRHDASGTLAALAEGLKGFDQTILELKPDLMVVLGDRFELLAACSAALLHRLPIAHIHGGETTEGAIDEAIRHGVTKMATLHFPSLEAYRQRILSMGEAPDRVFAVGALGVDGITQVKPMSLEELQALTGLDFTRKIALFTFHPVTLDGEEEALRQISEVLDAVLVQDFVTLATLPNADPGSDPLARTLTEAAQAHPERLVLRSSLGQRGYLSAMGRAALMVGNSSSGVIETPSFGLPTLDIGDRQKGRFRPANVLHVDCRLEAILAGLAKVQDPEFVGACKQLKSPFGDGHAAQKIALGLLAFLEPLLYHKGQLLKKSFFPLT